MLTDIQRYLDQLRQSAAEQEPILPVINYGNQARSPGGTPMDPTVPENAPLPVYAMGGPDEENVAAPITVTGARPAEAVELEPRSLGNRVMQEEAQMASDNAAPRKGMFGVKGTLRDVLGLVGDSFLLQAGGKPIYYPYRQKERVGDALSGFTQDPLGAVERLAYEDPEFADKVNSGYQQRRFQRDNLTSQENRAARDDQRMEEKDGNKLYFDGVDAYHRVASGANPGNWRTTGPLLRQIQKRYGLPPEYNVPETFDQGWSSSYRVTGMSPYQQQNSEYRGQELEVKRDNSRSQRITATRPRATPRPPQPSPSAYLGNALNTPPEKRNPEQKRAVENYLAPKKSGGRSRPKMPPRPAGF